MSRIANMPIFVPSEVEVKIDGLTIFVKGKNGELTYSFNNFVCVNYSNNKITFSLNKVNLKNLAIAGTTRALINNMIIGVSIGFTKKLQLVGIGYRVAIENDIINLFLGFSHPIKYHIPNGVTVECTNQTEIILKSADKQLVGQVAADLRSYRKPEPYKGKGIRYIEEIINIKEAKKK